MTEAHLLGEAVQPLPDVAGLGALLDRLSGMRLVLLGAATFGTSEFPGMRARITRELVARGQVRAIALAAGDPETWWLDQYVRSEHEPMLWPPPRTAFPHWLWRNRETFEFLQWLRRYNCESGASHPVGIWGLDPFDLYDAIALVLEAFDGIDPLAGRAARQRFAMCVPWVGDPAALAELRVPAKLRRLATVLCAGLQQRLERRLEVVSRERNSAPSASILAPAFDLYVNLFYGSVEAWFGRQRGMFHTLQELLSRIPTNESVVVWGHNTEVGDASATTPSGSPSLGQLCRWEWGDQVRLVGFGIGRGSVLAASTWGGPATRMELFPPAAQSYERLCASIGSGGFVLSLRTGAHDRLHESLHTPRLHRAIGAVYRKGLQHEIRTSLPKQFDEYLWFDSGHATGLLP